MSQFIAIVDHRSHDIDHRHLQTAFFISAERRRNATKKNFSVGDADPANTTNSPDLQMINVRLKLSNDDCYQLDSRYNNNINSRQKDACCGILDYRRTQIPFESFCSILKNKSINFGATSSSEEFSSVCELTSLVHSILIFNDVRHKNC